MQIPLSTILQFGPMGVPKLNPLEPPVFGQDFQFYEVSVMLSTKVDTNENGYIYNEVYKVVEE